MQALSELCDLFEKRNLLVCQGLRHVSLCVELWRLLLLVRHEQCIIIANDF